MKFRKIIMTTVLALSLGTAIDSNALGTAAGASLGPITISFGFGGDEEAETGTGGLINTAPTQPMGGIGASIGSGPISYKPFAYNITNINNTFGIRADRPLDVRLLVHARDTIENLFNQGRITEVQYQSLYNHVFKYSSKAACLKVYLVPCTLLRSY